ncbi:AAA family ATPase [Dysosmobacter sp. Sow4_B12]|uniref:cytidylate kinase-like family protein n=1 Tax=Dysosmobacter sp. Sow4_B12 TaxID=3438777 RepID=UPI003F8FAC39
MSERILTISREFGSGGRTVGRMAATALHIPCYDQEILEELAKKSGFTQGYIRDQGEYAAHAGWLSNALASRFSDGLTSQDRLWVLQRELILELAEKGPCVIVGRCADFILREKADCLTAFIHADMAFRAKRIVEVYGQRQDSPEKRLQDKDRRRAAYYQFYTDTRWGQARNYHIALDSGVLGIDRCAELLAELYESCGQVC